jgi:uncharacterized membrane protein (UPF0127 family)
MNNDFVLIKNYKLPIKIAITEEDHRNGLMWHSWPPPAMAFPYDKNEIRKFWMKNTPCPLDILFCIDDKIAEICDGRPYDQSHVGPDIPTNLVVELPKGLSNKLGGLKFGDEIKLNYSVETLAKLLEYKNFKN